MRCKAGRATARVAPTESYKKCDGAGRCGHRPLRKRILRCVGEGLCPSHGRGNRRSAAGGRGSEPVSRKCPDWRRQMCIRDRATTVAGNRLARRWAREPRPYECDTRGATGGQRRPPLRMRYKRCGEVWNPPVTASPCQPPLGKGARGTGVADCHSQCAHWLRNDSFLHGVWCMAGGRTEASAPTDTFIANCQWPVA